MKPAIESKKLSCNSAMCLFAIVLLCTGIAFARNPENKSVSSEDPFIVRKVDPNARCTFAPEYLRIKNKKNDTRVAFIELHSLVHADEPPFDFTDLCKVISEQTEDGVVYYDRSNGFFQVMWGEPVFNEAVAYFSGASNTPGVILYVNRADETWRAFVFAYRNNKWKDVTTLYLGPFRLGRKDYIVVPQYGRSARVITFDGKRFHHKLWLTWNGTKFTASTAKEMPGWRCPDSYPYFAPSERSQYCK